MTFCSAPICKEGQADPLSLPARLGQVGAQVIPQLHRSLQASRKPICIQAGMLGLVAVATGLVALFFLCIGPFLQLFNFGAFVSKQGGLLGGGGDTAEDEWGNAGCMLMMASAGRRWEEPQPHCQAPRHSHTVDHSCCVICPQQKGELGRDTANANEALSLL